MHATLLLLLEEVQVVDLFMLFGMILETVDALTALLASEVALLRIAPLLGNRGVLLNLAMRSLEAFGTAALLVDVGGIVAT